MTSAQRHIKLAYWKRVLAWNERKVRILPFGRSPNRPRYVGRAAQARVRIHELRFPTPDVPVPATGPDVSNLQGHVDFRKVKDAGHAFVILKCGEGDWADPTFFDNVKAARAAGLKIGAYHFLRPRKGRTGTQEAVFFIDRLRGATLGKGDLRPVLDVEATTLSAAATRVYVLAFAKALEQAGHSPMFYTYASFNGGSWTLEFGYYPLWIAAYSVGTPRLPWPWKTWAMWQFTDKAIVPGVNGRCDLSKTLDLRKVVA